MKTVVFIFMLLVASAAWAEKSWILTTGDLRQEGVELVSVDEKGVVVNGGSGERRIPLEEFLQVERSARTSSAPGKFVLYLNGGDRIVGEVVKTAGEQMVWRSDAVGEITIPMRQIAAMVKGNVEAAGVEEKRSEDQVRLGNGDVIKGIVAGIENGKVNVQVGTETQSPGVEAVNAIYFASTGQAPPTSGPGFRVRFSDGSAIVGKSAKWTAGVVKILLAEGTERGADATKVVSIEQMNGPVSWLSGNVAKESVSVPYIGEAWPARMDESVVGGPIRFGDRVYTHGIGVHSYSRLSYELGDAGWKVFRTQYAIDGEQRYADVTVRIKVDGKVVHEKKEFRAGAISPVVMVDVSGGKILTLEVDYGAGGDTQDRLNWIEPALMKRKPVEEKMTTAPAPASVPSDRNNLR